MHLTQIVGDKMQKLDLCEECAKAKGVNDPTALPLRGFAARPRRVAGDRAIRGGVEIKCPRCGFSQADFKKSGRLGCPECYKTFAEGLEGLLKTMHKGTRHAGKVPEALRAVARADRTPQIAAKETGQGHRGGKLRVAAQLRDEIKQDDAARHAG